MRRTLRRLGMRTTSFSKLGASSRLYTRWFYKCWALAYDATIALDPAYRAGAARMVDEVVGDGDAVLDVGVGTGLLAELCARRAASYTGLDYSGDMLARAARKLARLRLDNVALRWGDAQQLPFGDGTFDAVVSSFMLAHLALDDRQTVLREVARVLKPGGRLGLYAAQGEAAPLFATRGQLVSLLETAGFVELAIEDRDDVYRIATARTPSA